MKKTFSILLAIILVCVSFTAFSESVRIKEGSSPNVRSSPSTDGRVIGNAKSNQVYELLATSGNWYKIKLENGDVGWIASAMATKTNSSPSSSNKTQSSSNNTTTKNKYSNYSDIDWKGVSRNPNKYSGKNVQLTGYVLQVLEDQMTVKTSKDGSKSISFNNYALRVATKGKYDNVVYVIIPYDAVEGGGRILEDDRVTIYGQYDGIETYKTIFGASVSIPRIDGEYLIIKDY